MADEKKVWGIHTQDDSLFLQGNVIAIGWKEMGDLSVLAPDRESFRDKYLAVFPDAKKGSVATSSGMLFRFVHEMQIGDYVVFPSKTDRMVNIGVVESEYQYSPDAIEYKQQRSVKWIKHLPRMSFSQGALYEIGSFMSLFTVKNYADEFLSALDKGFKKSLPEEDESVGATAEEIIENTKDFILKEISRQLKGYMILKSLSRTCCRPLGTVQQSPRTVATAELTSPPIRMSSRLESLSKLRVRMGI